MGKDDQLAALDKEKAELISQWESKEKKFLMDSLTSQAEATEALNKVNDDLKKVKDELAQKTEILNKLEKDKKKYLQPRIKPSEKLALWKMKFLNSGTTWPN